MQRTMSLCQSLKGNRKHFFYLGVEQILLELGIYCVG